MQRSSPYHPLKFRVDCRPTWQAFFETIAAFNHDGVALDYAGKCRVAAAGMSEYRVMARTGKGWKEITKPEFGR